MKKNQIGRFILRNFRSYNYLKLDFSGVNNIVFFGRNGAGKTNILEAVSMLSIGNGLRSAKLGVIGNLDCQDEIKNWSVFACVENLDDDFKVGTEFNFSSFKDGKVEKNEKRKIIVDEKELARQGDILRSLMVVCVAPWQDRIFAEATGDRRKFFDNFVSFFSSNHNENLVSYRGLLKQRSMVLKKIRFDENWVDNIEEQIAELAIEIAVARIEYIVKINKLLQSNNSKFPNVKVFVEGSVEKDLLKSSAGDAMDNYKLALKNNREAFKETFSPLTPGVHRTDFSAVNLDKNIAVSQTSTGEQKLAIMSVILQNINLIKLNFNKTPIVLFDEIVAHIDENYRDNLLNEIIGLDCQCFFTGVEKSAFERLEKENTKFFDLNAGFLSV